MIDDDSAKSFNIPRLKHCLCTEPICPHTYLQSTLWEAVIPFSHSTPNMPAARLTLLSPATCIFSSTTRPIVQSRCQSQLQQVQQARNASILSSLSDNAGAYNKRIRRGRGPASGKGKTSGRGMNGQKQHGKTPYRQNLGRHFNGGQTPDEVVHGKRGFDNQYVARRPFVQYIMVGNYSNHFHPPDSPSNSLP